MKNFRHCERDNFYLKSSEFQGLVRVILSKESFNDSFYLFSFFVYRIKYLINVEMILLFPQLFSFPNRSSETRKTDRTSRGTYSPVPLGSPRDPEHFSFSLLTPEKNSFVSFLLGKQRAELPFVPHPE